MFCLLNPGTEKCFAPGIQAQRIHHLEIVRKFEPSCREMFHAWNSSANKCSAPGIYMLIDLFSTLNLYAHRFVLYLETGQKNYSTEIVRKF